MAVQRLPTDSSPQRPGCRCFDIDMNATAIDYVDQRITSFNTACITQTFSSCSFDFNRYS